MEAKLYSQLQQLTFLSQDFSTLLIEDRNHLKENDLSSLEKSHLKKNELMVELAGLIQTIEEEPCLNCLPGTFYSKLEAYAKSLPKDSKFDFLALFSQTREAIRLCQQEMNFNRNVLTTNLKDVKNLFSLLVRQEKSEELSSSTYDSQGRLETS